ncbi:MAG: hypothetical protein HC767_12455 [Akkermansiaceae bacterium]|nr:hypothetical protein [Akkermansiaceae bacterium]
MMQLVPGVRYVDLETDRGRFSTYNKTTKSFDEVEEMRTPCPIVWPAGCFVGTLGMPLGHSLMHIPLYGGLCRLLPYDLSPLFQFTAAHCFVAVNIFVYGPGAADFSVSFVRCARKRKVC